MQRPDGGACLGSAENTKEASVGAPELEKEGIRADGVSEGKAGSRITVKIAKKKTTEGLEGLCRGLWGSIAGFLAERGHFFGLCLKRWLWLQCSK